MLAAGGPRGQTLGVALLAVDPGRGVVRGVADPVAIPLAGVVGTGQLAAAPPPTGGRLGLVTRPVGDLVLAQTEDGDRSIAGRTG